MKYYHNIPLFFMALLLGALAGGALGMGYTAWGYFFAAIGYLYIVSLAFIYAK